MVSGSSRLGLIECCYNKKTFAKLRLSAVQQADVIIRAKIKKNVTTTFLLLAWAFI